MGLAHSQIFSDSFQTTFAMPLNLNEIPSRSGMPRIQRLAILTRMQLVRHRACLVFQRFEELLLFQGNPKFFGIGDAGNLRH
jgi:hypothetical protein